MSGERHLDWDALDRVRTGEASSEEHAHLAACDACREALADVERLATRFKASASVDSSAIPAARENAILAAARERAAAIADRKLVRLPWWKRQRSMALAASLLVAGSAAYLTFLTRDSRGPSDAHFAGGAKAPATLESRASSDEADGRARSNTPAASSEGSVKKAAKEVNEAPERAVLAERADRRQTAEVEAGKSGWDQFAKQDRLEGQDQTAAEAKSKDVAGGPEFRGERAAALKSEVPSAQPGRAESDKTRAPSDAAKPPASPAMLDSKRPEPAPAAAAPPPPLAAAVPTEPEGAPVDAEAGAAGLETPAEREWAPSASGLWTRDGEPSDRSLAPPAVALASTEIEVRLGATVARRMRQRFLNGSGHPIVVTYAVRLAPGERAVDLALTVGSTRVPTVPSALDAVAVWDDLPIAGAEIQLQVVAPPRPLDPVADGSVRVIVPVPPASLEKDSPPTLSVRFEPAEGYRLGRPVATGLTLESHPLGSGAWDVRLPATLGVRDDLLEVDVPLVKSGG